MLKIVGIDPGLYGALALVGDGFLDVQDMPTAGTSRRRIVAAPILGAMLRDWMPTYAAVEHVHAMPKQGVSSSFKFGRSLGVIEGALGALEVPIRYVAPAHWKRYFRLSSDKEMSRLKAIETWPRISDQLSRKKDHGRAEALLIAQYHLETDWRVTTH